MSDDPFDDIDPDEREGDPFAGLDDAVAAGDDTDTRPGEEGNAPPPGTEDADPQLEDDPFGDPDASGDDDTFGDAAGPRRRTDVDATDPFADFDADPAEDPFESGDWDASGVDDSVWEDLSTSAEPDTETEAEGTRRYSEVNKHSFCEQCEYFSGPPGIACAHDGTEILEFLDMETVKVVDCPVVEEREELGDPGSWQ